MARSNSRKPGNPAWKPGVSGNPAGRPKKSDTSGKQQATDAVEKERESIINMMKEDSWTQLLGGLGNVLRDKRMTYVPRVTPVGKDTAISLWRSNDLAGKLIEVWPDEMLREGYNLSIPGEKSGLESDMSGLWDDLNTSEHLDNITKWKRAFGGSALLPGVVDKVATTRDQFSKPLIWDNVIDITYLNSIESDLLHPVTYYKDPTKPKFNDVETWRISATGKERTSDLIIHESRLITLKGLVPSKRDIQYDQVRGWGDSVLVRAYSALVGMGLTWDSVETIIQRFSILIMKMKGLAKLIALGKTKVFRDRMIALEMSRDIASLNLVDEEEEMTMQTASVQGLPDVLVIMMQRLAAIGKMPVTKMFGISPGGMNATGESDTRNWYDEVHAQQRKELTPALEMITRASFKKLRAKEPDNWKITYPPLWQMTDTEKATRNKTQADADKIYHEMGLSAIDIVRSRFEGEYSLETNVDFDQLESKIQLETEAAKRIAAGETDIDEDENAEIVEE